MPPRAPVNAGPVWGPFTIGLRAAMADAPEAEAAELEKKGQRYAWIQISKSGTWAGHESGPFQLSRAHFESAIVELERRQNPLSFDYEHASASCIPTHAPAAGWSKQLEIRGEPGAEELWAYTRLTKRACAEIADDEYRYISPTWMFDHPDRELGEDKIILASLHSVALTNVPFLDGMQPVTLKGQMSRLAAIGRLAGVALAAQQKGLAMDPEENPTGAEDTARVDRLLAALGLADRAALDAWISEQETAAKDPPTDDDEKPAATKAALDLALAKSSRDTEELEALRAEKFEREVTALVASGRALEEERPALLELRRTAPELFTKLTEGRKAVVPMGRDSRVKPSGPAPTGVVATTEVERRIAANLKAAGFGATDIDAAITKHRAQKEI